jgi:hypothetical protein
MLQFGEFCDSGLIKNGALLGSALCTTAKPPHGDGPLALGFLIILGSSTLRLIAAIKADAHRFRSGDQLALVRLVFR